MQRALVIGLGISGLAAAKLLLRDGYEVVAIDRHALKLLSSPAICQLIELGVSVLEESSLKEVCGFSLVIVSPGVTPNHPLYLKALIRGIEIIGEAELAFRRMHQPCIAITGTNGKTTVTLLVEHILRSAGKKARALGNVGHSLAEYFLAPDPEEIIVAELSSYQLETLTASAIDAGVILNITPDHLDRYKNMRDYAYTKCRLQLCIKPQGVFYVHEDILAEYTDLFMRPCIGYKPCDHDPKLCNSLAAHDRENMAAARVLTHPFGISYEQFLEGANTFNKPPHRIEYIANINGVNYYDDSKGTNVDAVIKAVDSMPGPVHLLAGGVDKGASYQVWQASFTGKVKKIYIFGEGSERMARETSTFCSVEIVGDLEKAVRAATLSAKKGECVLLSPGCASWDMFRDYAHRGEEFRRHIYKTSCRT